MAVGGFTERKGGAHKFIFIREFDPEKDVKQVEELERRCEVGANGSIALYTDLLGDPVCRIRHTPAYKMLVAEYGKEKEMVGLIRGSVKAVVCGNKQLRPGEQRIPLFATVAYILGLRVSPTHRRMGIGLRLVGAVEEWFRRNGADYAYMATEKDNEACMKLFVEKCGFTKFRTPAILVHPVHSHSKRISIRANILKLDVAEAESLYRECMGTAEFFPKDIDTVLGNRLSLGSWVAVPRAEQWQRPRRYGAGCGGSTSWAVISVWNTSEVFKMKVKGVRMVTRMYAATSRFLDQALPWLNIPSVPDVFRSFGVAFLYGVHAEGPRGGEMMNHLCRFAHNLAREKGCRLVATEVGGCDPLKHYIPHWNCFSCPEDLWCIKKLTPATEEEEEHDWSKSAAGVRLFVDPREF
eukprot:PITA_13167